MRFIPSGDAGAAVPQGTVNSHSPVIDGLRALSIVLVLAAHLLPLGPKFLEGNVTAATMGMSLFFALSGYLIVRSIQHGTVFAFVVRRLARILPLAWLYIAIIALLYPQTTESVLITFALALNYRGDLMLPVTAHLWSLGVEIHFYLAIALLILCSKRALFLVWPLCLGITFWRIGAGAEIANETHLRVDEILVGACLGTLSSQWLSKLTVHRWMAPVAICAWIASSHPDAGALQYVRPYTTIAMFAAILSLPEGRATRWLGSRLSRYIASISYALYVIHPLFAHGFWNTGSTAERYLLKRPIGIAFTFLLAHLSTFYWEKRWNTLARKWLAQRAAPQQRESETGFAMPKAVIPQSLQLLGQSARDSGSGAER
jgi:peptidoglycan/LPS O-acetylase OafA/YrhL